MNTQVKKLPPVVWIAAIAITLFSAAGIAAIMGWLPDSMAHTSEIAPLASDSQPRASSAAQAHVTAPIKVASATPVRHQCTECGVIESTHEVSTRGSGSGLGAVGGAVIGGLLGNQVGAGNGKDLATVVGAVGGGLA